MKTFFTEKRKIGIAAFGIPVLLTLLIMIVMGEYPFGDNTMLVWDMDWQYSSFFVHLHDIMHGDASPWYSFSRAIGGDMIGVAAYYLISPFNLLFYFFDAENIYAGIALVMILKIGAIGWAMNHYLYQKRPVVDSLIFSIAYALSGYVVGYFFNIIWLDGIMALPLMVLGIERLVEERKYFLYVISLGFAIMTSFYIGYMLCIFSVMYFICYFFLISEKKKRPLTILIYAGGSLLAGALSACVALPTVYAMQDGKSAIDLKVLKDFSILFDYRCLIENSFMGTIDSLQISNGTPLMYSGVLALLLVPAYFLLREVSWKKKVAYFGMLAFLVVSLGLYNLCSAWQAFNLPNGSPYRFSFLYIFLMLLVSNEAYGHLCEKETRKKVILAAGGMLLLLFVLAIRDISLLGRKGLIAVNLILILFYAALWLLWKKKNWQRGAFLGLMSLELCLNAVYLYHYSPLYENTPVSEYEAYVEKVQPIVEQIKEEEGLYRTVLTDEAYRTVNDNMFWNLYGLDSYTSVERNSTQLIAFHLGYYRNMIFGIHYNEGSTQAAESLLGVRYLVSSAAPEVGYELIAEEGSLGLYENQNALPLAFMADTPIMGVVNEEYNTFEYQNALYASIDCMGTQESGETPQQIFTPAELEQGSLWNCEQNPDGTFSVIDTQKDAYVEYRIKVQNDGYYYLHHIGSEISRVVALIHEQPLELANQGNVVKRLGYLTKADEVRIWCFIEGDSPRTLDKLYVYHEDNEVLASYAQKVSQQEVSISYESEDEITITCRNSEKRRRYMLISIPYDEGWTVYVDQTETTPYIAMGNLMLIGLEPGEHVIELCFTPLGLREGAAVTGAAVAILVLCYVVILVRKKKHHGEKEDTI